MGGIDAPKNAPRLGPATMSALRLGQRTTKRPTDAKLGPTSGVRCIPGPGGWEEWTKVKVDQGQTRAQVPVSMKEVLACSNMRLEDGPCDDVHHIVQEAKRIPSPGLIGSLRQPLGMAAEAVHAVTTSLPAGRELVAACMAAFERPLLRERWWIQDRCRARVPQRHRRARVPRARVPRARVPKGESAQVGESA